MNNRGQTVFYAFMIGVIFIVCAMAFATPLRQFIDDARAPSTDTAVGLDCANASISKFDKGACTVTDLSLPYFTLGIIGIAGIVIGAKLVYDGGTA